MQAQLDATADYADEMMRAALDIDMPNYASAIATAQEVADAIASLRALAAIAPSVLDS
jgi:hypothetical protein